MGLIVLGFTRVPPGTYCCSIALVEATGDPILGKTYLCGPRSRACFET